MSAPIAGTLPSPAEMYAAVARRDLDYDGIFFVGVGTTGIFCRPGCPARTPKREHTAFFSSPQEALAQGYRACLRCRPTEPYGAPPPGIEQLLGELAGDPTRRIRDRDLRDRGLDPAAVRRWFQRHHGMTFQSFQRAGRIGRGLGALAAGARVSAAAFDTGYDSLSAFQAALRSLTGRPPSRSRDMMVVHTTQIPTPLGPMVLGGTESTVTLFEFGDLPRAAAQMERLGRRLGCVFVPGSTAATESMRAEVERYFSGALRTFETPLETPGTDFQREVWGAIAQIPFGETRSYADVARAIGRPTAVRAVARATGSNRIAIAIPCHRVVGSDGSLTGYGGGLARKRFLLALEGVLPGSVVRV